MAAPQIKRPILSLNRDRSPDAAVADRYSIEVDERDIRVDDYINDKLQTNGDFNNLDSLIASVETQHAQLQDQLQDAQAKLAKAKEVAAAHTRSVLQQVGEFQAQQESIDRRLQIVTASDAPDEAVARFKGPMEKLRRLELASAYVELLMEVDDLTAEARKYLPDNPKEALKPYARLKQLSITLRRLQEPAEGAASHLVTHVEERVSSVWDEMKKIMSAEFETVLKKTNWPASNERRTEEWNECFKKLLELQTPEILNAWKPVILLPMAVMTKPFIQQFRYHFMGNRPTNSIHNPEYVFEWTIGTISKWQDFFYDNVGPVLVAHFRGTRVAGNSLYTDPVSAFICAFLPIVREKVNAIISAVAKEPQLLSNFMLLLMKFDEDVRKQFKYDGGDSKHGWKGLTWEVLDTWFDRWLTVENEFALSRYEDIVRAPDSGLIDYDSTGVGKTKPTYGASKVTDLLSNVTKLYQPLCNFSWKLRFLIDIQIAILDQYHNRLRDSLDVYQAITSTVGRTLHGVTKEQQAALEGTGGLESLCKVYGSAENVVSTLQDWSNDIFFVGLWDELQRTAKKTDVDKNLAGPISYIDVRNSTSSSVGSDEDGALFDETITAFKQRRDHAERLMIEAIQYAFPSSLSLYINKPQWLTVDDDSDSVAHQSRLAVTAELDQPLQFLSANMAFLHKTIATAPFRRIWHASIDTLQDLLWRQVLMREKFTTIGAAQFYRDLTALWEVIDDYIPNGSSSAIGMPKLREASQLLNLPTSSRDGLPSVTSAFDRVFSDNAEAKKLLDELGFSTLTFIDARLVLHRRVEATSDSLSTENFFEPSSCRDQQHDEKDKELQNAVYQLPFYSKEVEIIASNLFRLQNVSSARTLAPKNMDERPPPQLPLRLQQYLLACLRRDLRVYITQRLWTSNLWPPGYSPEDPAIHRTTSVLVFCSVWQVPAALTATLLSIVAIVIGRLTLQWQYALVLACCAWLPGLLIWGIAIVGVRALSRELRSAWVAYEEGI